MKYGYCAERLIDAILREESETSVLALHCNNIKSSLVRDIDGCYEFVGGDLYKFHYENTKEICSDFYKAAINATSGGEIATMQKFQQCMYENYKYSSKPLAR